MKHSVEVLAYSMPIVLAIEYIGENSISGRYASKLPTRLLISAASIATVLLINQMVKKREHQKILADGREFLNRWGHCKSPSPSSLQELDSDVRELICY